MKSRASPHLHDKGAALGTTTTRRHHEWQRLCSGDRLRHRLGAHAHRRRRGSSGSVLGTSVKNYPRWGEGALLRSAAGEHQVPAASARLPREHGSLRARGPPAVQAGGGVRLWCVGSRSTLSRFDTRCWPTDRVSRLALDSAPFAENPNAMFVLWKDHTAVAEAERLNHLARTWGGVDYTKYVGGIYSSEWFWAKAVHILETDPAVAEAAVTDRRALRLDSGACSPARPTSRGSSAVAARPATRRCGTPSLAATRRTPFSGSCTRKSPGAGRRRWGPRRFTADTPFGTLSAEWAARLGLPRETVVAVGAFDAHMGAVGGGGIGRHRCS